MPAGSPCAISRGRRIKVLEGLLAEAQVDLKVWEIERHVVNVWEMGRKDRQIRLAALMAKECRDIWHLTEYHEWHLGDQHRKGSSKPPMLEEQGVSVEYVPGIVAPNEWHRLKSFSHRQRGAMAFVWEVVVGSSSGGEAVQPAGKGGGCGRRGDTDPLSGAPTATRDVAALHPDPRSMKAMLFIADLHLGQPIGSDSFSITNTRCSRCARSRIRFAWTGMGRPRRGSNTIQHDQTIKEDRQG